MVRFSKGYPPHKHISFIMGLEEVYFSLVEKRKDQAFGHITFFASVELTLQPTDLGIPSLSYNQWGYDLICGFHQDYLCWRDLQFLLWNP